ncbi:glycosyltransferase [uncultured Marinobacter sp.]|uniref:glycosyltransferase n=1 Tax=uncultured Marinobacter sp. TaxID=187379 RepID=UPI00262707ED|nr:glycosyltransferase [uncultured Marinobacter sp.]
MKICQVMAGDGDGGLENHFAELCNGLAMQGCEVVAIAHAKYSGRFEPSVRFISLNLSGGRRNPVLLARLALILRREAPDIIHAQANKAVEMLARVRAVVPGYRIGSIHSRKRSTRMFSHMNTVIGVSKGVVSNVDHPDLRVVYNGMTPYFSPSMDRTTLAQTFGLDPDMRISLAVGRLVPVKAFDNLILAWRPSHGQLVIVGEGPERTRLEATIRRQGLEQCVKLAGFRADVRGMMQAADLLVFASHREGFSYVLAEALLSGLPVLSTRVPGAEEVLPQDYLVECNNIDALSCKLTWLAENPDVARQSQRPVFLWAQQALTFDSMVAETIGIYREVMGTT